jgi:Regulator of ribonuclease activity B
MIMFDENLIQETIEGNMRRNAELLEVLHGKGIALDFSRRIEFHFWAWSRIDAEKLKGALAQNGAIVKDVIAVKENGEDLWSVTAEFNRTPALAASIEQTKTNVLLAAQFDCVYDGWGMRL